MQQYLNLHFQLFICVSYFREFIESKERGVEKFYNEDNNEKENVDEILLSDTDEKTLSLDTDDENNQNEGLNFKT